MNDDFGSACGKKLCKQLRTRSEIKALEYGYFLPHKKIAHTAEFLYNDYIQKTFTTDDVYNTIKLLLSESHIRKKALHI